MMIQFILVSSDQVTRCQSTKVDSRRASAYLGYSRRWAAESIGFFTLMFYERTPEGVRADHLADLLDAFGGSHAGILPWLTD